MLRWPPPAAHAQVRSSHGDGGVCARSHCKTLRWPPRAAYVHELASHGHKKIRRKEAAKKAAADDDDDDGDLTDVGSDDDSNEHQAIQQVPRKFTRLASASFDDAAKAAVKADAKKHTKDWL